MLRCLCIGVKRHLNKGVDLATKRLLVRIPDWAGNHLIPQERQLVRLGVSIYRLDVSAASYVLQCLCSWCA
jgi:hypothetical protein